MELKARLTDQSPKSSNAGPDHVAGIVSRIGDHGCLRRRKSDPQELLQRSPENRKAHKGKALVDAAITASVIIPRKRKQDEIIDHESKGGSRKSKHIDQAFTASKPNTSAPKNANVNHAKDNYDDLFETASSGFDSGSTSALWSIPFSAQGPALRDSARVVEDDISLPDDDNALSDTVPSSPLCLSDGAEYAITEDEVLALTEAASTLPIGNLLVSAGVTSRRIQVTPQQDKRADAEVARNPAGGEGDFEEMSTTEFGEDFLSDDMINPDSSTEQNSNLPLAKQPIDHRRAERCYDTKSPTSPLLTPEELINGFMSEFDETFFEDDDEDADDADQKEDHISKVDDCQCVPELPIQTRHLNDDSVKCTALAHSSLYPATPGNSKSTYSPIHLAPIVRSTFPEPLRDRSPIVGLSSDTFLRTCFRVGEALKIASRFAPTDKAIIIELYARVMSSHREDGTGKQHFTIRDIFHDNPPHLDGVFEGWKGVGLWDDDSSVFLDRKDGGRLCRCVGRMRREGKIWMLVMMNIWEAGWDDVEHVREIVSARPS